jgi:hypothetical protein
MRAHGSGGDIETLRDLLIRQTGRGELRDLQLLRGDNDGGTEPGSYSTTHRDYPNQDINILRRFSKTPLPSPLTVQAATADTVTGASGNPYTVYRSDLGVQTTSDTGGGWNTGGSQTWQTISAGTFTFNPGTYHTVQIQYLTGGFNVNWWQATNTAG